MFRPRQTVWLFGSGALCACFGKVDYGEQVQQRGTGGHLQYSDNDAPALAGGGPSQGSGGGVGATGGLVVQGPVPESGGAGGATPMAPRPPPIDPECEADCCQEGLVQVTFSTGASSIEADAQQPHLSGSGAWIVFTSGATNLVEESLNGQREVFLYSLKTQQVHHASAAPSGEQASGESVANGVSDDGRWTLLTSRASDLTEAVDQNSTTDVFVFDQVLGERLLISTSPDGGAANGSSFGRDISPDGRFVVYSSEASDLTDEDTNEAWDVFVWDRETGLSERISMGPGDQQRNVQPGVHAHISDDGRYVSYHSLSDQLTPESENGVFDIFVTDRERTSTTLLTRSTIGALIDGNAFVLGMSGDARFVSSYASATNWVDADSNGVQDVFLIDRTLGSAKRVNLGPGGQEANSGSSSAVLSSDGRFLSFASSATNLVEGDDNQMQDSFVYDQVSDSVTVLSRSASGALGNGPSQAAHFSSSGTCYVFSSTANNLSLTSTPDEVADLFVGRWP